MCLYTLAFAAPTVNYQLIIALTDGGKLTYHLSDLPKLLWEGDSLHVSAVGKKTASMALGGLRSLQFVAGEEPVPSPDDVNGDGQTDTQDVLSVYEYMQSGNSSQTGMLDVNGDGTVDTQDVLHIYESMMTAEAPARAGNAPDQMVVVTTRGNLVAYTITSATALNYSTATDTITIGNGVELANYECGEIKQVYFADKATVDADPYIAPTTDDHINPNLVDPEKTAYEVVELDTTLCRARIRFEGNVPQMYVGQIYIAHTDSIHLGMYLLTFDPIDNHQVDIRYRPAQLQEMVYNCEITLSSSDGDSYFEGREVYVKCREQSNRRRAGWKADQAEKLPPVKLVKDIIDILDMVEFSMGTDYSCELSTELKILLAEANQHANCEREIASKLDYVGLVYRGRLTVTNKLKLKIEGEKKAPTFDRQISPDLFKNTQYFQVGPVPVLLSYDASIWARLTAELKAQMMFAQNITNGVEVVLGAEYDAQADKLSPINEINFIHEANKPDIDVAAGTVKFRVSPYLRINLYLYLVFGFHIDLMPFLEGKFDGMILYDKPFWQYKFDAGFNFRAGFFVEGPRFNFFKRNDSKTPIDQISYTSPDLIRKKIAQYPAKLVDLDSIKREYAAYNTKTTFRFKTYGTFTTNAQSVQDWEPDDQGSVQQSCWSDFPAEEWKSVNPEDLVIETGGDKGDDGDYNVIYTKVRNRMPAKIRAVMPRLPHAPIIRVKRKIEPASQLHQIGEPWATQSKDDGVAYTEFTSPVPLGYRTVLRTSLLDGEGNSLLDMDREMPWEIQNYDATISGTMGFLGTIEYRNGGRHIHEVEHIEGGTMEYTWNGTDTHMKMSIQGMQMEYTYKGEFICPIAAIMGYNVNHNPGVFISDIQEYDVMRWMNKELGVEFPGISFGETYYLGHECKTLREVTPEGSGTTVMYQNLILRLLSTEGDVNVTSLKIYDEIENPITITQH